MSVWNCFQMFLCVKLFSKRPIFRDFSRTSSGSDHGANRPRALFEWVDSDRGVNRPVTFWNKWIRTAKRNSTLFGRVNPDRIFPGRFFSLSIRYRLQTPFLIKHQKSVGTVWHKITLGKNSMVLRLGTKVLCTSIYKALEIVIYFVRYLGFDKIHIFYVFF